MQRRVFLLSAAAGTALVAGPGVPQAQQIVWEEVASADGRYRLKIPRGYRYLTTPAHGGTLHSYVSMLPEGFTFEFLDLGFTSLKPRVPSDPAEVQSFAENSLSGLQKSWPGSTVLEQRPVTAPPFIGREFTFATAADRVAIVRLYFTPAASFTQVAQAPLAQRGNPLIAQFMDSLRFG